MKKNIKLLCICCLLGGIIPMTLYASRSRNKIIEDTADPFILKANGKYYLYATTLFYGFSAYESTDLKNWENIGEVYNGVSSWGYEHYWAPEVYEKNGKYYMIYSARWRANSSLRIGLAVSDSPKGPFEDLSPQEPLFDFGYAAIDGHIFWDNGKPYLFYSRDNSEYTYEGKGQSHIYAVELSTDLTKVITPEGQEVLISKPEQSWERKVFDNKMWNEGPFVIKVRDKYILTYSGNFFGGSDYSLGYAISDHVLGPYVKSKKNPFLKSNLFKGFSGPGHHALFYDKDRWYIVYHAHKNARKGGGERDSYLEVLNIDEDYNLSVVPYEDK